MYDMHMHYPEDGDVARLMEVQDRVGIEKAEIGADMPADEAARARAIIEQQAAQRIAQERTREAEQIARERADKERREADIATSVYSEAAGMPQTKGQRNLTERRRMEKDQEVAQARQAEADLRAVQGGNLDVMNRLLGITGKMVAENATLNQRVRQLEGQVREGMN